MPRRRGFRTKIENARELRLRKHKRLRLLTSHLITSLEIEMDSRDTCETAGVWNPHWMRPLALFFFLTAFSSPPLLFGAASSIAVSPFGETPDGEPVRKFTIENSNGIQLSVIEYGATIIELLVPDAKGELKNVVLGSDDPQRTGRAELRRWLATPVEHLRDLRSELLLKLVIAQRCGIGTADMLAAQRAHIETLSDAIDAQSLRATR